MNCAAYGNGYSRVRTSLLVRPREKKIEEQSRLSNIAT